MSSWTPVLAALALLTPLAVAQTTPAQVAARPDVQQLATLEFPWGMANSTERR